jgi:hypothetical protein
MHGGMVDLHQALRRFPDRATAIRRLFLKDQRFRSICEDLSLAETALFALGQTLDGGDGRAAEELRLLRDDLEAELLRYLDGEAAADRPAGGQSPPDRE